MVALLLNGPEGKREQEPMLPLASQQSPTAYVAGGAFFSWRCFWFCMMPALLVVTAASAVAGLWLVVDAVLAIGVLYVVWFLITGIFFRTEFQLWALQRPDNWLVRLLLPLIELLDSARVGDSKGAMHVYKRWGPNFCAAGQVWLSSYTDVAAALRSPQARTYNLGEHPLIPESLPSGEGGRCIFLLSLSDKAATGTGDHEAFRQCVVDCIFTPEAVARETDAISMRLLDDLAKDFAETDPLAFYTSSERGNHCFWIKYLHHVLFGMEPGDAASQATLRELHGGESRLGHYLAPLGHFFSYGALIEKVATLYEASPALAGFKEGTLKYNNMTKRELSLLMVAIMRIAGVQGSQMYVFLTTAGMRHGYIPIDTRDYWDSVNLDDDAAVRRYALECTRLSAPVTVAHRVAKEPFSCNIKGKAYTFPKGTKIGIPICLAMVDKEHWGADAFEFNPDRPNLEASFLGFNSVGGMHAGRECPAKDLVLRTVVRVLQLLGKQRSPVRKPVPARQPSTEEPPSAPPLFCC